MASFIRKELAPAGLAKKHTISGQHKWRVEPEGLSRIEDHFGDPGHSVLEVARKFRVGRRRITKAFKRLQEEKGQVRRKIPEEWLPELTRMCGIDSLPVHSSAEL